MRTWITIPLISLAFLSGCETYYKRPSTFQAAYVRFSGTAHNHKILIANHESQKCETGATGGIMGVVGGIDLDPLGSVPAHIKETGNSLNMIGYNESTGSRSIERTIAADRDFIFTISRLVDFKIEGPYIETKICRITYQLTPKPEVQYEISYFENKNLCYAEAYRLHSEENGSIQRLIEPSFRKANQQCR